MRARLRAVPPSTAAWIEGAAADATDLGAGEPRWLLAAGTRRREPGPPGERLALRFPAPAAARGSAGRARRILHRLLRRFGAGRPGVAAAPAYARPLAPGGPPVAAMRAAGTLVLPAGAGDGPPAWLARVARDAGHDVASRPWSVLPARGYLSQKVLFLLDGPPGERGLAVKITQDAAFNARLENEHRGLVALAERPGLPPGMAPRALFEGRHRDLLVVGETALEGVPFPHRSTGRADCPVAARALDRIDALATVTAGPATGAEHAAALAEIVARLEATYRLDALVRRTVRDALDALALAPQVPTVFVHGDPGEWNLLVDDAGNVAFLDWENAELQGPPLWDLFAFLQSYARFCLDRAGVRPTAAAVADRLLAPSPFADLLADRALGAARRLDVPAAALEPLWILHAATVAVREAWRLSPDAPERGTGFRWLQMMADRRAGSPVLARLRGVATAGSASS